MLLHIAFISYISSTGSFMHDPMDLSSSFALNMLDWIYKFR